VPKDIEIHGRRLEVGDEVLARHYMPDKGRWSDDRRNYRITSLDPLMGTELWEGGGGEPRQDWQLSRQGMELIRSRSRRNPS
jgi:hypothetical protein